MKQFAKLLRLVYMMKKIFPIIFILAIVTLFFKPFLINRLLPIPSDTIAALYYPFRDLYTTDYPRGVPFKNFLITDPVRQQYPWRNLAMGLEKYFQLPLWNPYNFSGVPLLANIQSASFYPLNILFFILPFQISWSVLIMLQPLLAGVFFYLYAKNLKLNVISSLIGAIAFSFCGFFTAWMEWNTVVQVGLWLPLILLSIDKILFNFTYKVSSINRKNFILSCFIFIFSLTASFFAGHLQTFFYVYIITTVYFLTRWFQYGKQTKLLFIYIILNTIYLILTSIQWIPAVQFINLSGRSIDMNWHKDGWFIPWQNLLQFFAPDFFGNPATNNYWGVWNYGEFIGYVGVLPLILSLFALFFRRDKKTLFFGTIFFLSLIFALPTFFAQIPFILSIPLVSTSQPTRLLFVTDFSLAVLTALGLDYFLKTKTKEIFYPIGFICLLLVGMWCIVLLNAKLHLMNQDNLSVAKHNLVLPTILFVISALLLTVGASMQLASKRFGISPIWAKNRPAGRQGILPLLLLLLTAFDLFRFSSKYETFASSAFLFPKTNVLSYLQNHAGTYRIMATDSRTLPPNFSIMYKLQSVDGYDPLYLLRYAELLVASERGKPDIHQPFGFNRIITPENYHSPIINLLGVKYILSLSDIKNDILLKRVHIDAQTQIYENTHVLPRAFFVSRVTSVGIKQQILNELFDPHTDLGRQAFIENNNMIANSFSNGTAKIISYSDNTVTIKTNNAAQGFLVLTDIYYPTWHASIDGKETKIFLTDYIFRGIVVPKGKHTVTFYDTLF